MLPDYDLDDLLAGMVAYAQKLESRIADLEKIEPSPMAWGNSVSGHLLSPFLRGFWPGSSMVDGPFGQDLADLSGQGRILEGSSQPFFSLDLLLPYVDYAPPQYHWRASEPGLQIFGNEDVDPAYQGLTIAGLFWIDSSDPNAKTGLVSMWDADGNDCAYWLNITESGGLLYPELMLSGDGVPGNAGWTRAVTPISTGRWYHITGRWKANVPECAIFIDGVLDNDVPDPGNPIPGLLHQSSADFEIAWQSNGDPSGASLDGRASHVILCAGALPDYSIAFLNQYTRSLHS